MFDLNDMRNLVEVLGDVIKPGTDGPVFCSVLQLALWYNALALEKVVRDSNRVYFVVG